jgi:hypothetical protein
MLALPLLLLLAPVPAAPQEADASALRSQVTRLEGELRVMRGEVAARDAFLGTVRDELALLRGELKALRERPQPVAAPFLAAPPPSSDRFGAARTAVFAPRVEVESFLRHDTVVLRVRRLEASGARLVAELELTPDLSGIDLPIDESGAVYLVDWSTSEGHVYNLVLRDGASGLLAASCPVKEKQAEGRFALVGYRVD